MDETTRKSQDNWIFLYLTRYPEMSECALKIMLFVFILRANTNCIRLEKDEKTEEYTYNELRAIGIHNKALQVEVMGKLAENNILIPLNKDTNHYIDKRICNQCPVKKDSQECIARHGTHWININVKDWHLYKRSRLNRAKLNEVFAINKVPFFVEEKKTLNDKIKDSFDRQPPKETKAFHESIAFQDFQKSKYFRPI